MTVQNVFARSEIKYIITAAQRKRIEQAMSGYMRPDEFGRSDICSVYYDTPGYILIRRSLESPVYKEKLRLRSYGIAKAGTTVYAEIKKKYDSVVYKRRIGMPLGIAETYLSGGGDGEISIGSEICGGQISRELNYFLKSYSTRYGSLRPAAFISSEREAFYAEDDHEFRITFDENILARDYDLSLDSGIYGAKLLRDGTALMEVKAGGAIPLWMCSILSRERLYKSSFSKYGSAYLTLIKSNITNGERKNAKSIQWIV